MSLIPSVFGNRRSSVFDPFSALDTWDPFRDFGFPSASSLVPAENSAFVNTRIDWRETPQAHVFKADLPGMKKEEVKVEIEEDRVLQISGERNVEKEDKNDTWHRVERSSGKFARRFRLPENAKMDQVKASTENGVLTLRLVAVSSIWRRNGTGRNETKAGDSEVFGCGGQNKNFCLRLEDRMCLVAVDRTKKW